MGSICGVVLRVSLCPTVNLLSSRRQGDVMASFPDVGATTKGADDVCGLMPLIGSTDYLPLPIISHKACNDGFSRPSFCRYQIDSREYGSFLWAPQWAVLV